MLTGGDRRTRSGSSGGIIGDRAEGRAGIWWIPIVKLEFDRSGGGPWKPVQCVGISTDATTGSMRRNRRTETACSRGVRARTET